MKPLIIANWKMNPDSLAEAILLARRTEQGLSGIKGAEVVLAPPYPFLETVGRFLKKAKLGAQDVFWSGNGPYTGEVSWRQLKSIGVHYIVVGHSERKIHLYETEDMINKKVRAVLEGGLKAVLCIGEFEQNGQGFSAILGEQLKSALRGVPKRLIKNIIIAYEPVWAVSTMPGARPDTPDNAFRALLYIRKIISRLYGKRHAGAVRIIYGGSVKAQNVSSFLRQGHMEGVLVGGASLDPKEFAELIRKSVGSVI